MTILLALLIIQRLSEVRLGQRNLKKLRPLVAFDHREKNQMLLLHSAFFISCLLEYQVHGKLVSWFPLGVFILILCQLIRLWTIKLLGPYWVPWPLAFENQRFITRGPYAYLRHPNYLVVAVEVFLVPLLGSCYWTTGVFTILNGIFLKRRIEIEERALELLPGYSRSPVSR